ncbi:hypothetical protein [Bradyrhizobium sp. ORS 86]|uniref:hypothetical protein n=1 Tax=Bradyrhizobium sp. ORS 86 TaxID=1685970 RepID=UPI00388D843D
MLIAAAQEMGDHIDAKGRRIVAKALDALQYFRLTKIMGASSSNDAAMDLAAIACTVRKIDAQDIAMPATERDVEFLIQQLGFEGISAAGEALKKLRTPVAKPDQPDGAAEAMAAAKN